jgi:RHS repeat-associated protein
VKRLILALTVTVFATNAFAWYQPAQGRWLSRDPLGLTLPPANEEDTALVLDMMLHLQKNLYAFVDNDSVQHIDPLGLLKFKDCTPDQQRKAASEWSKACDAVNRSPDFKTCLCNDSVLGKLQQKCKDPNFTIECEQSSGGNCRNACGWAKPWGGVIHLCPDAFSGSGCGDLKCTILHEMTHTTGSPREKWPEKAEKCLGCP